jgi:hypothetical protein
MIIFFVCKKMSAPIGSDVFQVMYLVDRHIVNKDWHSALACLLTILTLPTHTFKKEEAHLLKRAARIFTEINGALSNEDEKKQAPAAVQLLALSKVKACEWLGTQGIAATMLNKDYSPIGDIEMNPESGNPFLIQADNYCVACYKANCTRMCSGCKNVFYCSAEHQKSDWHMHKVDCAKSSTRGTILWNSTDPYEEHMKQVRAVVNESLKTE